MHFKPAVMMFYFVGKMERKTTKVQKMTVMYWKSGLELYIFTWNRLEAPDTKHQTQQSVLNTLYTESPSLEVLMMIVFIVY